MSHWSKHHQSLARLMERAAPLVARLVGIVMVAGGAWRCWQGRGEKTLGPYVFGVLLMALGISVGLLWPVALRLFTILLVAFAIVVPVGLLNPFAEMDLPGPRFYPLGYELHRTVEALGLSATAILLAHLIGVARLQRLKARASTPVPAEPER